jgi:hypothetical protein
LSVLSSQGGPVFRDRFVVGSVMLGKALVGAAG